MTWIEAKEHCVPSKHILEEKEESFCKLVITLLAVFLGPASTMDVSFQLEPIC